jgi:hypothetical protein
MVLYGEMLMLHFFTNTSNVSDYLFIYVKLMWFLKLALDQNLIVIHPKSNNNFKIHINLGV